MRPARRILGTSFRPAWAVAFRNADDRFLRWASVLEGLKLDRHQQVSLAIGPVEVTVSQAGTI